MSKSISVSYLSGEVTLELQLTYVIQMMGDIQSIACSVDGNHFPNWLQLRKFELLSLKEKSFYTPLFNEINNNKNIDTVLFIDKVYAAIMRAEKLKVRTFEGEAV